MFPVREQCIRRIPEHFPHVRSVINTGVKVCVIWDMNRQHHFCFRHGNETYFFSAFLRLQRAGFYIEQFRNPIPYCAPVLLSGGNKCIECRTAENFFIDTQRIKIAQFSNRGQVQNVISDRNTSTWSSVFGSEDAKWQVLDREIGVGRYLYPGFKIRIVCSHKAQK